MTSRGLDVVAHHEAGHAVAAYVTPKVFFRWAEVTVSSDKWHGQSHQDFPCQNSNGKGIVGWAGVVAEWLYLHGPAVRPPHWLNLVRMLSDTDEAHLRPYRKGMVKDLSMAWRVVMEHWGSVEALAMVLTSEGSIGVGDVEEALGIDCMGRWRKGAAGLEGTEYRHWAGWHSCV